MPTDTPLRSLGIGVITGVQDHQLNITEDRLDRVIIGTAFWQRDPMEFQLSHQTPCLAGLTRVCRVPIQSNPDGLLGVPTTNLFHEVTHFLGGLVLMEGPAAATRIHFISAKQIEHAAGLLRAL